MNFHEDKTTTKNLRNVSQRTGFRLPGRSSVRGAVSDSKETLRSAQALLPRLRAHSLRQVAGRELLAHRRLETDNRMVKGRARSQTREKQERMLSRVRHFFHGQTGHVTAAQVSNRRLNGEIDHVESKVESSKPRIYI